MKKVILIAAVLVMFISHYANGQNVEIKLSTPTNVNPNEEFEIDIKIAKGNIAGFARFQLDFPEGFTVKSTKTNGATFSYKENKARFLWMSLPEDNEISINCLAIASPIAVGSRDLEGTFSYVLNNETQRTSVPIQTINVGGDAVAIVKDKEEEPYKEVDKEVDKEAVKEADKEVDKSAEEAEKLEAERKARELAIAKAEQEKREREEAERKQKEEEARKAKEEAMKETEYADINKVEVEKEEEDKKAENEADRIAKENAERIAKEEAELIAKENEERIAKENEEKRAKEEAEKIAEQEKIEREKAIKEAEEARLKETLKEEDGYIGDPQKELEKEEEIVTVDKKAEEDALALAEAERIARENAEKERIERERIEREKLEKEAELKRKEAEKIDVTVKAPVSGSIDFRVQVGASREPAETYYYNKLNKEIKEFNVVQNNNYDGWYRYTIGSFNNTNEAHQLLSRVKALGFDCFVVAFKDGKRIQVQDAKKLLNQ